MRCQKCSARELRHLLFVLTMPNKRRELRKAAENRLAVIASGYKGLYGPE